MSGATKRDTGRERGSGEIHAPEPRYLVIGRVQRPHGVRGELRVKITSDYPDRLVQIPAFYLAHPGSPEVVRRYSTERARLHSDVLLLKLAGLNDRTAAEGFRGMLVQISVKDAVPLEEGEYYHFQVIGMRVETDGGELLGRIVDVLRTGANDVFVVRGPRGEILLPAISDVISELDLGSRQVVVHLLPGMLPDDWRNQGE